VAIALSRQAAKTGIRTEGVNRCFMFKVMTG